ncbi:MAG: PaaI family thioesterase [Pacificibacter sp.]|uniref:PaaI family thioesterase n=1 Tax=Pacificibacter sp. TaxID=1917866 RepID=UPI0032190650
MTNVMDKAALQDYLSKEFGPVGAALSIEEVTEQSVTLRLTPEQHHIRLGGTVSGPSLFMLADVGFFFAILARLGPVAMAVTTNASIDFMRKPDGAKPVLGECTVHKLGRTLAVGQVLMRNPGSDKVLAQASMTYAIPPKRD